MHECLSVQDWIKAWGDPEREGRQLAACPRCSPDRSDPRRWAQSIEDCPECKAALEATPIQPDEVLDCPRCMESFDRLHRILDDLEHFDPSVATEALRADAMLRSLTRLWVLEQLARVTDDLSYQQWGLCQRLLYEARELWCQEPELANDRATVALAVAQLLDGRSYHPQWVNDLRAKAHAYLGNTFRILGHFDQAEQEFLQAELYLRRGVESGQARARVFSLKVSLLVDQSRCEEAEALLDRIEAYYESTHQDTELARTQLQRAKVLEDRGAYDKAAEECAKASSNLAPRTHPRLSLLARQNAVHYLLHAGEVERARKLFDRLPRTEERMVALRREWMEADLLRAEGELILSMQAYQNARRGYREEGLYYATALLALDEAETACLLGDLDDMAAMVEEASILLVKAAARHEALAVIRLLLRTIEGQTVTRATVAKARQRIGALKPS